MPNKPNIAALAQEAYDGAQESDVALRSITADVGRLLHIPVSAIKPNPHQPRRHFDKVSLQELSSSLKQHGLLQPVAVCKNGHDFELIAGERRLRAAKMAGLLEIPAYVRENVKTEELAIIENVQREELHPLELAEGLQHLKERHTYTNDELGSVIGKSKQTVSEILSLNDLPDKIKNEYRSTNVRTLPKTLILQVVRAGEPQKVWDAIKSGTITTVRAARTERKPQMGRPKNFIRHMRPEDGKYRVTVAFSKQRVSAKEIKAALKWAYNEVS